MRVSSNFNRRKSRNVNCSLNAETVAQLLQQDVDRRNCPPHKDSGIKVSSGKMTPVSPTRALNRTSHVCRFLTRMFEMLVRDVKIEVGTAFPKAYDQTLAKIHTWIIRKTVGGGRKVTSEKHLIVRKTVGGGRRRHQKCLVIRW